MILNGALGGFPAAVPISGGHVMIALIKFEVTSGASVMKEEIQKALKSMIYGKATGRDELPAEALKALDEHNIEIITSLCNIIYNSGMISTGMNTSDKLEAFEMWLHKRMLRISWKEHKTNGIVLHKIKTKRSLLNTIKKRKCQYFGHIIRGDGVQRLLMEGRINGRRGRGRPRTMWTDNIKEWTKIYNDCIRVAQDRERWRSMTADLLTTDGT